jgi:ABC-2 type transport system permease protein
MNWFKTFIPLAAREFRLFKNNPVMVMLLFGGPVMYGLLFGAVYQKGKLDNLPIIVVDKDNSPLSTRFTDLLNDMDVITVVSVRHDDIGTDTMLMADKALALVVIPNRFEADILQSRYPGINANMMTSSYVSRALLAAAGALNAAMKMESLKKKGLPANVAAEQYEAFHLNTFRLYNTASNYMVYSWPSYLAIILQSVLLVVMALSFTSEYERGSFFELWKKSGCVLTMMAAKVIPYWIISIGILGVFYGYHHLFREPLPRHLVHVAIISALFIATTTFMGMIASIVFKTQLQATQFLMVLSMTVYIASGYSWPFDQYGWAAQLFGYLFPMMPFVNGFRILLIQNGTLHDIGDFMTIQCIQLLFYFMQAYMLLKRKVKHEIKKMKPAQAE